MWSISRFYSEGQFGHTFYVMKIDVTEMTSHTWKRVFAETSNL